jgi:hypothetical protein
VRECQVIADEAGLVDFEARQLLAIILDRKGTPP